MSIGKKIIASMNFPSFQSCEPVFTACPIRQMGYDENTRLIKTMSRESAPSPVSLAVPASPEQQHPDAAAADLFSQIKGIEGLHSERQRHRYSSWRAEDDNFQGQEKLSDQAAQELTDLLAPAETPAVTAENPEVTLTGLLATAETNLARVRIRSVAEWVKHDPDTRIDQVEGQLARHFKQPGNNLTLPSLLLPGEINQYRSEFMINDDLALALELKKHAGLPFELRDQLAVLNQLDHPEAHFSLHKILDFMHQYFATGQDAVRSFLATESEPGAGDKVLALADRLPARDMKKLLQSFGAIVGETTKAEDYLRQNFRRDRDFSEATIDTIRKSLLAKGTRALTSLADQPDLPPIAIQQTLDNAKAELLLFASTFQTLREENKDVSLEDFRDTRLEASAGGKLSAADRAAMFSVAEQNWAAYPELKPHVMARLKEALKQPDNQFYLIKHKDELVAFCRFDPRPDGRLYAASLNVRPTIRGADFGRLIQEKALAEKAKDHVVEADANPALPIIPKYLGEFGFTVTGVIENYGGAKHNFWQMERDDSANESYRFAQQSTAAIKKTWQENQAGPIHRFSLADGWDAVTRECEALMRSGGNVITAIRPEGQEVYVAFEPRPAAAAELPRAA